MFGHIDIIRKMIFLDCDVGIRSSLWIVHNKQMMQDWYLALIPVRRILKVIGTSQV